MTELLTTPAARFAPQHTAVVVIDMQNDFCAEDGFVETAIGRSAAACRAMVPHLAAFLKAARGPGVPVVWVRANYDADKMPRGMLAKQRQNAGDAGCCITGSVGAEFYGVMPEGGEPVFDKHCFSAFAHPELGDWLSARGIASLVFTGVQTHVCVDSSLRDAVNGGFYAGIARDCVASHAQPLHEATLATVGAVLGDVLEARAYVDIWRGEP